MGDIDPWDALLDVEADYYNVGYREGQEAAVEAGFDEHGQRAGFMKGYVVGMEIGFMEGVTSVLVESEHNMNSSFVAPLARTSKRRAEVLERLHTLPTFNDPSVDFPNEINQIRSMFKQCGSSLEFLPKELKDAMPTQEW